VILTQPIAIPALDDQKDAILVQRLQARENNKLMLWGSSDEIPLTTTNNVVACNILKQFRGGTCPATPLKDLRDEISLHSDRGTVEKLNQAFTTVYTTRGLH
jgi:hypothetical protein